MGAGGRRWSQSPYGAKPRATRISLPLVQRLLRRNPLTGLNLVQRGEDGEDALVVSGESQSPYGAKPRATL